MASGVSDRAVLSFPITKKELEESGGLYSEMKCMQNMALVEWKLEGSV